jgi:hypothetical protein
MKTVPVVVAAAFALSAPAAHAATITVSPASAAAGSTVSLSGSGFAKRARASVQLGARRMTHLQTDRRGAFSLTLALPTTLSAGKTSLLVRAGARPIRSPLYVVPEKVFPVSSVTTSSRGQRVFVSPAAATSGAIVRLSGRGFARRGTVRISFGSLVRSAAVRRGSFSSVLRVPALQTKARTIVIRWRRSVMRIPFRALKAGVTLAPNDGSSSIATKPGARSDRVLVNLPFELDFTRDHGGLGDRAGIGTGFTYTPPSGGSGYVADNIAVNVGAGTLTITTTQGIAYRATNTLDNALSVGLPPSSRPFVIKTTVLRPPPGTRNYEQAGLWFGSDQDNYLKLVVISMRKGGTKIQALLEVNRTQRAFQVTAPLTLGNAAVALSLRADPATRGVSAYYGINGPATTALGTYTVPGHFFGLDPSRLDSALGTSSFAGIFASQRHGAGSLRFTFDDFSVTPG